MSIVLSQLLLQGMKGVKDRMSVANNEIAVQMLEAS